MAQDQSNSLRIDVNSFHLIWEVAGFNKIPFISSHPIPSPSFTLNNNSETLWQLAMAKEIRSKVELKDDILIFESSGGMRIIADTNDDKPEKAVGFSMLKSDSDGQTWETVKYYVQIKAGDAIFKTEEKIENGDKYYKTESFCYIFSSDLKGMNLFEEENITIEAFIEHKQVDPRPLIPSKVNRENFTKNLTCLFKSKKYTDIILKAGKCEIAAHKCILTTRTRALEHRFEFLDDDDEGQTLDLGIDDESVAEAFLIYAYCGRIPMDFPVEKYAELYATAEKYEAEELQTLIKDLLASYVASQFCSNCVLEYKYNPEVILGEALKKKCVHKLKE